MAIYILREIFPFLLSALIYIFLLSELLLVLFIQHFCRLIEYLEDKLDVFEGKSTMNAEAFLAQ